LISNISAASGAILQNNTSLESSRLQISFCTTFNDLRTVSGFPHLPGILENLEFHNLTFKPGKGLNFMILHSNPGIWPKTIIQTLKLGFSERF
jgi:hypothetical protein